MRYNIWRTQRIAAVVSVAALLSALVFGVGAMGASLASAQSATARVRSDKPTPTSTIPTLTPTPTPTPTSTPTPTPTPAPTGANGSVAIGASCPTAPDKLPLGPSIDFCIPREQANLSQYQGPFGARVQYYGTHFADAASIPTGFYLSKDKHSLPGCLDCLSVQPKQPPAVAIGSSSLFGYFIWNFPTTSATTGLYYLHAIIQGQPTLTSASTFQLLAQDAPCLTLTSGAGCAAQDTTAPPPITAYAHEKATTHIYGQNWPIALAKTVYISAVCTDEQSEQLEQRFPLGKAAPQSDGTIDVQAPWPTDALGGCRLEGQTTDQTSQTATPTTALTTLSFGAPDDVNGGLRIMGGQQPTLACSPSCVIQAGKSVTLTGHYWIPKAQINLSITPQKTCARSNLPTSAPANTAGDVRFTWASPCATTAQIGLAIDQGWLQRNHIVAFGYGPPTAPIVATSVTVIDAPLINPLTIVALIMILLAASIYAYESLQTPAPLTSPARPARPTSTGV